MKIIIGDEVIETPLWRFFWALMKSIKVEWRFKKPPAPPVSNVGDK